jgi:hypothetical protein
MCLQQQLHPPHPMVYSNDPGSIDRAVINPCEWGRDTTLNLNPGWVGGVGWGGGVANLWKDFCKHASHVSTQGGNLLDLTLVDYQQIQELLLQADTQLSEASFLRGVSIYAYQKSAGKPPQSGNPPPPLPGQESSGTC